MFADRLVAELPERDGLLAPVGRESFWPFRKAAEPGRKNN
jgi:hypothetical protein